MYTSIHWTEHRYIGINVPMYRKMYQCIETPAIDISKATQFSSSTSHQQTLYVLINFPLGKFLQLPYGNGVYPLII